MTTIYINNIEYKYRCVYCTKRAVGGNIGIICQLEVFKDGIQIDKKDFNGYVAEKIEEHIRDSI